MSESNYEQISNRIAALDERPVAEHPQELEAVHREIVAELEQVGSTGQKPA